MAEARALHAVTEDAAYLAGGHSLVPLLKNRLAQPRSLIDVSRLRELKGIVTGDGELAIGASVTHAEVAESRAVALMAPALIDAAKLLGDPAVRARGTIGGSLAFNDPMADYPAVCLTLDATIQTSERSIGSEEFFTGMLSTALRPSELLVSIRLRNAPVSGYVKFRHPAAGFALVGVCIARTKQGVRVAVTGAGANGVFRVSEAEQRLSRSFSSAAIRDLRFSLPALAVDVHASAEYRAHLVHVLIEQAVDKVIAREEKAKP